MLSRIQTLSFVVTVNGSGEGEATKILESDIIIGKPIGYEKGSYEQREFFDLYIYSRAPQFESVTGGGNGGGAGGASGILMRSPPTLTGALFKKADELVVSIRAGTFGASKTYHIIIPYQVVTD